MNGLKLFRPVLFFCVFLLGLFAGIDQGEDRTPQFSQIQDFYSDLNFIGSLSTRSERARLTGYLDGTDPDPRLENERLREILRRMRRVCDCILFMDPHMLKSSQKDRPLLQYLFGDDLLEVQKIRRTQEGMAVEVAAYDLDPAPVLHFIREFEEAPEGWRFPPLEKLLAELAGGSARSREVHLWKQKNGRWMKQDSHFTFLDLKK